MGNTNISAGKLQFFPTSEFETYRLLGLLGNIEVSYDKKQSLYEELGYKIKQELENKSDNYGVKVHYVIYDYLLKTNRYDLIKEHFTYVLSGNSSYPITICDAFAGEGEWLNTFKTFIPNYKDNNIYTIANEIEENRYKKIEEKRSINENYNLSFEELELPKHSISIMLYNPPYDTILGDNGRIRSFKYYLQMIVDRKLLYTPSDNSNDYKVGTIVGVVRKDDFLDSLDVICKYFDVEKKSIYKVDKDEYDKYKQYMFIARIRKSPYDISNIYDSMKYQDRYNEIKMIIEEEPEFKMDMYNLNSWYSYPSVDYFLLKENLKQVKNADKYISKNDGAWKWIIKETEIKDLGNEKLTIPKNPKLSDLALMMSAGYVNGSVCNSDGTGKHIVVGGTKKVTKQEITTHKGEDGRKVTETKMIKLSKPYLNILCAIDGVLTIKELEDDNE